MSNYLKHLLHDRLDRGREHLLLRGEGAEDVVVLVGPVELLVRHSDAVVRRLRVHDVQVARGFFPVLFCGGTQQTHTAHGITDGEVGTRLKCFCHFFFTPAGSNRVSRAPIRDPTAQRALFRGRRLVGCTIARACVRRLPATTVVVL